MSRWIRFFAAAVSITLAACGGGGGGGGGGGLTDGGGSNVVPIIVDGGLSGNVNQAFISVRVCVPNSSQCHTVDHVLVDTGSVGLRLIPSALGSVAASLPQQTANTGEPLAECIEFVDTSHAWGPVRIADIKIGEKTADNVRIQLITSSDTAVGVEPVACGGGDPADNLSNPSATGINGIIGIGVWQQDCGTYCTTLTDGIYYRCANGTCVDTTVTLAQQVPNPIAKFASDNNGSIIDLPAVASSGAVSASGSLIFGIGTRSNNSLGNATRHFIQNNGYLTTRYKGIVYDRSFIDSGSNGLYFPDNAITKCEPAATFSFYCPAPALSLSAVIYGDAPSSEKTANFIIENADVLFFADKAHPALGGNFYDHFAWGLPFFYGRDVYTAIEGQPGISAPYIAF